MSGSPHKSQKDFKVLRHFDLSSVKSVVAQHCKTHHVCQTVGKPNQTIPLAPLCPIPVVGEPFKHILVDCVGPLPSPKSGNQYLLTIVCRFTKAAPLRKNDSFNGFQSPYLICYSVWPPKNCAN